MPSLAQLEDAVAELRREMPDAEVTVVVDATFAHRIGADELSRFEEAALRGEYVYPPAGAIGRGDAFLLRIAERVGALVLSNDSFQEFHGEHEWLFERGRLLGATPVPGIGWIFVPRTPVRGPKSRVAVRDAHRAKERVEKAIVEATKEAVEPDGARGARRSRRTRTHAATSSPQAINDPITFIGFIADHPLGGHIEADVESFSSHGAVVRFGEVHCYVPLSNLGSPPPKSAREVLRKGDTCTFVVTALDPYRRGVELALPDVAVVSGHPTEETVAAEVRMARRRKLPDLGPPPMPTAHTPPPGRRALPPQPGPVEPADEGVPAAPEPLPATQGMPPAGAVPASAPPALGASRRRATKAPAAVPGRSRAARAAASVPDPSPPPIATPEPARSASPGPRRAVRPTKALKAPSAPTKRAAAPTLAQSPGELPRPGVAKATKATTTSADKVSASRAPATKAAATKAAATKATATKATATKAAATKATATKAAATKATATKAGATKTPATKAPTKVGAQKAAGTKVGGARVAATGSMPTGDASGRTAADVPTAPAKANKATKATRATKAAPTKATPAKEAAKATKAATKALPGERAGSAPEGRSGPRKRSRG